MKTKHEAECEAIAQKLGIEKLRKLVPVSKEQITKALESGDEHLNTITLGLWDKAAGKDYTWQQPEVFNAIKGSSLAERVSVLKHVAKFHMDEPPTPEPEPVKEWKPQEPVDYQKQAQDFLTRNGIKFRATLSDSKVAPWDQDDSGAKHWSAKGIERHHYRVTLSREGGPRNAPGCSLTRLTFDFWGSIADAEKGVREVSAYDVLACISSDANAPEVFEDYCAEYGESTDSIKAKQTYTRLSRFAKRLRAFFTESELEQLAEIQ